MWPVCIYTCVRDKIQQNVRLLDPPILPNHPSCRLVDIFVNVPLNRPFNIIVQNNTVMNSGRIDVIYCV